MYFRTAASLAVLACVSHVAAEPQPYQLAVMSLPGLSLMRRDTGGYQPELSVCGAGNTCAEACGGGYLECPSHDKSIHCYNPAAQQSCCTDGSGNSCDAGFYCTHDDKKQTWCCPDSMDLVACAAAYTVKGGLDVATSTSTTSTSTKSTKTSTKTSTTKHSTKTHSTHSTHSTKIKIKTHAKEIVLPTPTPTPTLATPTPTPTTVTSYSSAKASITGPVIVKPTTVVGTAPATKTSNAAVANGINGLAILAAGIAALW